MATKTETTTINATPKALEMLTAAGIDPATVTGSGKAGRIIEKDAKRAIASLADGTSNAPTVVPDSLDTDKGVAVQIPASGHSALATVPKWRALDSAEAVAGGADKLTALADYVEADLRFRGAAKTAGEILFSVAKRSHSMAVEAFKLSAERTRVLDQLREKNTNRDGESCGVVRDDVGEMVLAAQYFVNAAGVLRAELETATAKEAGLFKATDKAVSTSWSPTVSNCKRAMTGIWKGRAAADQVAGSVPGEAWTYDLPSTSPSGDTAIKARPGMGQSIDSMLKGLKAREARRVFEKELADGERDQYGRKVPPKVDGRTDAARDESTGPLALPVPQACPPKVRNILTRAAALFGDVMQGDDATAKARAERAILGIVSLLDEVEHPTKATAKIKKSA